MTNKKVLSPSAAAKGYGGQAMGEDLGEGVIKKLNANKRWRGGRPPPPRSREQSSLA